MSTLSRSSHALVTGGGRGIGRAVAAALSQAGAVVTVLGRNRATLDEAVASGAAQFAAIADVAAAAPKLGKFTSKFKEKMKGGVQ